MRGGLFAKFFFDAGRNFLFVRNVTGHTSLWGLVGVVIILEKGEGRHEVLSDCR